jgi:hypothetical protein
MAKSLFYDAMYSKYLPILPQLLFVCYGRPPQDKILVWGITKALKGEIFQQLRPPKIITFVCPHMPVLQYT